ncbi:MAG: DUF5606 domain-containing protein [Bacteroidota bacterium]|nr:DUF5606 domain-containing protein [Bacteroidota bacterium]
MSLKGIISISGVPGLYKVLAQTKSGFIVESLNDKKRMPVASTQRISMLEDISVFTNADDLPLKEVMLKLIEQDELIDAKAEPAQLREFFLTVVPDYDAERVYPSDIKKIINWFHLVKDFVAVEDEPEAKDSEESEVVPEEESKKKAPAKATKKEKSTAAPKKKAKPAAEKNDKGDTEKAPAKTKKKTASK